MNLGDLSASVCTWMCFCSHQNLNRKLVRSFRMSFVRFAKPNCEALIDVLIPAKVTRLSTLVASMRQSMLMRSPMRNVRVTEAFIENCEGPMNALRGAVPHSPDAGTLNANGFA